MGCKVRRIPKKEVGGASTRSPGCSVSAELLDRRPRAAVRWPAAARGDGTRDRSRAEGVPHGRAAVEPRRQASGRDARVAVPSSMPGSESTTVYVTHDQVEAMTLGQRVAVMRDGQILQIDRPQRLYEEPQDLFVAALHRLAGHEPRRRTHRRERGHLRAVSRHARPRSAGRRRPPGRWCSESGPRASRMPRSRPRCCRRSTSSVAVLEELGADSHVLVPRRRAEDHGGDSRVPGRGDAAGRADGALQRPRRSADASPGRGDARARRGCRPASTSSTRKAGPEPASQVVPLLRQGTMDLTTSAAGHR